MSRPPGTTTYSQGRDLEFFLFQILDDFSQEYVSIAAHQIAW